MLAETRKVVGTDVIGQKREIAKERRALFLRRVWANKMVVVGGVIIFLITLLALAAPLITQFTPYDLEAVNRLKPPNATHWFGTDNFGRDIFSRVVYGARVSLAVGLSVAIITGFLGLLIGMYSSFYRILDHILMRIADGLMAFPSILLAIAIMAVMGPKPINVVIAIVIVETPGVARIVRSAALVVKEQTYIEAARAQGASSWKIIWSHIAPNVLTPLIVQITYVFSVSMIIEASLSFLGAGIPVPEPSWGNILYDGKSVIQTAWWMTVFPGMFLLLAVLGSNLLGDGIRDLIDPQSNKAKK
ncbi:ABC transporter permease [Siminovitchia fortis]|uniref:ABC transporter permease n=1 Tax=Siminovitchia fortis TaxID=254758 RepID=A0A443IN63_9BACI|nr:ABC transporter permease [Siminovitchia fortis]RWR07491.1 ABC transporter permease [Siminovitchia fortis]WHY81569.1 ABC transporter permease [Siminovitchia fortis]